MTSISRQAATDVIVAALLSCLSLGSVEAREPDPHVLLRAVRASREGIRSGHFEYKVTTTTSAAANHEFPERRLIMDFAGTKLRCEDRFRDVVIDPPNEQVKKLQFRSMNYDKAAFVRAGLGDWQDIVLVRVFDGRQCLGSSSPLSAAISEPPSPKSQATSGFFFDPRTLGLSYYGAYWESLDLLLDEQNATSIECKGREAVNGRDAWHIVLTYPAAKGELPAERHLWVGDQEGFPVYRCVIRDQEKVYHVIESTYEDPLNGNVLPIRVKREGKFDKSGLPAMVTHFEQIKGEYGVELNPSLFDLTGLGLAPGAAVTDNRVQQVIGYWNGSGLSVDPEEAIRVARAGKASWGVFPWVWLAVALCIVAACSVFVWARRKTLRATLGPSG